MNKVNYLIFCVKIVVFKAVLTLSVILNNHLFSSALERFSLVFRPKIGEMNFSLISTQTKFKFNALTVFS